MLSWNARDGFFKTRIPSPGPVASRSSRPPPVALSYGGKTAPHSLSVGVAKAPPAPVSPYKSLSLRAPHRLASRARGAEKGKEREALKFRRVGSAEKRRAGDAFLEMRTRPAFSTRLSQRMCLPGMTMERRGRREFSFSAGPVFFLPAKFVFLNLRKG